MIKSVDELLAIREQYKNEISLRNSHNNMQKIRISVGTATCGIAAGSRDTLKAFIEEIKNQNISNTIVVQTGCLGFCYAEPTVELREYGKAPILYGNVDPARARRIVTEHVMNGTPIKEFILNQKSTGGD